MTPPIDLLIIGQGLAGTHLAFQALAQNHTIRIIDNHHKNAASIVAAGLINPIKGKRLVPLWNDHKDLEKVLHYYQDIENILHNNIIRPLTQLRKLQTTDTQHYYAKKKDSPPYTDYLKERLDNALFKELKQTQHPLINVAHSYQVETQTLLKESHHYFQNHHLVITSRFHHDQLILHDTHIKYGDLTAKAIVFCEGYQSATNPLWAHLDWENAKGTVLTFHSPSLKDYLYNLGKWIAPTANHHFKCGSTSEWEWDSLLCRSNHYTTLTQFLADNIHPDYTVTSCHTGVRPILKERKPIAKRHPHHDNVWIVNGLGNHGCFWAPLMSEQLLNQL